MIISVDDANWLIIQLNSRRVTRNILCESFIVIYLLFQSAKGEEKTTEVGITVLSKEAKKKQRNAVLEKLKEKYVKNI